jgi:ATP-dependent exoDNAse (exonuclease V) beta subunit
MNGSAGSADTREALAEFPLQTSFVNDCEIYIRAIFSLAINVRSEYAALKLASGTVDYNDMESYCFKLLGMDSVQESLVQELDFLVVDEFQDSSPLQLSIFLMLAQCAKSVIFVGDINQSIYGFRGTDSQLIKGFEEAIRSVNPKAIFKLPDSHRSDKNLVDFANQSFAQAFEGQDFTLNPLNHKQVGSMPFRPLGQDKRVAVWDLEEKSIAPCMDELAKHIKNLIESAKLQAYDKSEKKYRVLEYRDVAVLAGQPFRLLPNL